MLYGSRQVRLYPMKFFLFLIDKFSLTGGEGYTAVYEIFININRILVYKSIVFFIFKNNTLNNNTVLEDGY
jgi:hypothetical protein